MTSRTRDLVRLILGVLAAVGILVLVLWGFGRVVDVQLKYVHELAPPRWRAVAVILTALTNVMGFVVATWWILVGKLDASDRAARRVSEPPSASPPVVSNREIQSAPSVAPSADIRVKAALAQHIQRAFTAWWKGLGAWCPGCNQSTLSTRIDNERRVSGSGPNFYHFTSFDVHLHCTHCSWTLRFPHTDDPPQHTYAAPQLSREQRSDDSWSIGANGVVVGTVVCGQEVLIAPKDDCPEVGRASLAMASAMIVAASSLDLSESGEDSRSLRHEALKRMLALHRITIEPC